MTSSATEWNVVLKRLEKLERQNRRLKQLGAAALVVIAAVVLLGQALPMRTVEAQAPAIRTVEANEFILRDESGTVRASLSMETFGPQLMFLDANGDPRVVLEGEGILPGLRIMDHNRRASAKLELWCSDSPSDCSSKLTLTGVGSKYESSLKADKDSSYLMMGEALRPDLGLGADENGSTLELHDRQGFLTSIGNTDLVTPRTGETHKTSAASVVLFDKDKNVIWQAP